MALATSLLLEMQRIARDEYGPQGEYRLPAPAVDRPEPGTIVSVDSAAGTAEFTLDNWDQTQKFAAAPYPKIAGTVDVTGVGTFDIVQTPPTVGQKCMVVFEGFGIDNPYIVALY